MKTTWQKIKDFFSKVWHGLTVAGRIIFGVIILGIIAVSIYAANNKSETEKNDEENKPEVAQTFEPSIGSPIPADTQGNVSVSGQVGGASTTEPSDAMENSTDTTKVAMIAPETGINPTKPVPYQNDVLRFAATLPPGSNINESSTEIRFANPNGSLQYLVSVNQINSETIADIQAQLTNSTTAKNITQVKFAGINALTFTADGYGSGLVFVANSKAYYLFGNNQYFNTFKLL